MEMWSWHRRVPSFHSAEGNCKGSIVQESAHSGVAKPAGRKSVLQIVRRVAGSATAFRRELLATEKYVLATQILRIQRELANALKWFTK